jgi:hypothetical protein
LDVSPNPNDGNAIVKYNLRDSGESGEIIITDLMGKDIAFYKVGPHGELNLSEIQLSAGVYICTLTQNSKKIVMQKFVKF